jgi:alcohol dehydrogenase, propanol-preferring
MFTAGQVKNFKKGDRVMSGIPRNECGECASCKQGNDYAQYCQNTLGMIGVTIDGAFAEYHVSDARLASHVPDNVSLASAAPLACAGCTIYRAILVSGAKKGSWIAIVGAGGGLGHLGIQFAKAKGINVVAVDARDEGIELCKKAGAEHVLDVRQGKEKVVEQAQALTGGLGVDCTINVSEHDTSAALSCAITRMHGTLVQVAQPAMVSVPFTELIFRNITIKGTLVAGQEVSQEMLNEVGRAGIDVETKLFYGLDKVPEMVELAHSGKLKGKAVCVVDEAQLK